jgi:ATP:corrinoid adenosyltransferase
MLLGASLRLALFSPSLRLGVKGKGHKSQALGAASLIAATMIFIMVSSFLKAAFKSIGESSGEHAEG